MQNEEQQPRICELCGKGPSEHSVVGYTVVCKPGVTDLDDDDD
ncbi:MAG TPA: hypothetical protein VGB70_12895 [Allosphingosinicella sp.]|jgi:hypothetical protein